MSAVIGTGGPPGAPGPGFSYVNKFGVNLDIDAGPEDIWSNGGLFKFLDAGISMSFKSTVAADTLAGTGAQKIRITYYRTDNTEVIVDKDMDGVTPVLIDADVKIVTRVEVIQAGSGTTNAGKITVVDTATGLLVYQSVEIGEGQTLSAVQMCPKGKAGLVVGHSVTYAKTQNPFADAEMRLNIRKANGTLQVKHPAIISAVKQEDKVEYPVINGVQTGIAMEEGDIVFWRCLVVGAADTPIEARFDVRFEDAA
jgi:hypothetical protein